MFGFLYAVNFKKQLIMANVGFSGQLKSCFELLLAAAFPTSTHLKTNKVTNKPVRLKNTAFISQF